MSKSKPTFDIRTEVELIETAEIPVEGLMNMRPVIVCKPTQDNDAYLNGVLARNRTGRLLRNRRMTAKMMRKIDADDRHLIAHHCAVGWNGVVDADGNDVPFSAEACHELFKQLPDRIFRDFRDELTDPTTFEQPSDAEIEATGKN